MNPGFKDVMSKRTDEELIKIVTVERDGYQPIAIEAAEAEINKRNIDITTIEQITVDLTAEHIKQEQLDARKVSSSTRLIHTIVDTFAFFILTMLFAFIVAFFIPQSADSFSSTMGYLLLGVAFFCYYILMETKYQKTLGKFMTKTKVVTKDGAKPELGDIVTRTFCRLIPFDRISFLFTDNGFHDRFSDTTVIKDEI